VFSAYKFHEIVPGCCPHPGDIVESGSLAVSYLCLLFNYHLKITVINMINSQRHVPLFSRLLIVLKNQQLCQHFRLECWHSCWHKILSLESPVTEFCVG